MNKIQTPKGKLLKLCVIGILLVSGVIACYFCIKPILRFVYLWQTPKNSITQDTPINISSILEPDFSIYLAETGDIIVSGGDVISYDDITHTFKLSDKAIKRLENLNGTQGLGNLYQKDFVVKLYDKELYRGKFWSVLSSLSPSGIFMSDPTFDHINNEIRISVSPFVEREIKDMLDNNDLSQYFESKEKLVSISNDQSVSSTEKILLDLIPYQNDYLGISFEYPRYYMDTQCGVAIEQNGEENHGVIGSRIEFSITPYSESVLNVNHLVSSTLHDVQIATQKNIVVGGKKALQVGYSFGGMGRYGEIIYIIHDKKLYTFGFTAGWFECGFEPMVYEKIVETLRFK